MPHHDPGNSNDAFLSHPITNHGKGVLTYLVVWHDIVGRVKPAMIDFRKMDEVSDVNDVIAFKLDSL